MLHYDRIDLSKGIDVTKSNSSKECITCYYWFVTYCCIILDISKTEAIRLLENYVLSDHGHI